jgi:hypothetical protein
VFLPVILVQVKRRPLAAGDPEYSLITRSSDGQLMFLVNKLSKMKHGTSLGSGSAWTSHTNHA